MVHLLFWAGKSFITTGSTTAAGSLTCFMKALICRELKCTHFSAGNRHLRSNTRGRTLPKREKELLLHLLDLVVGEQVQFGRELSSQRCRRSRSAHLDKRDRVDELLVLRASDRHAAYAEYNAALRLAVD